VPDRIVAFGRQDRTRPGYAQAVAAVRDLGFTPVERLAGGRAAVFHELTLSFSWAIPDPNPRRSIHARFSEISGIVAEALAALGIDARVGEIPGEYCPGRYSVNAGGLRKVMGVGQRLVRGAAHIGGVVVVGRPELVNLPLGPAYGHLGYEWDPAATGAVSDERAASTDTVAAAIVDALRSRYRTAERSVDPETLRLAERLEAEHVPTVG
jgi:lipoate-protein ligase A